MTAYEISTGEIQHGEPGDEFVTWRPRFTIEANGAEAAIRAYASDDEAELGDGVVRAIPVLNITERSVTVQTRRALTLSEPGVA